MRAILSLLLVMVAGTASSSHAEDRNWSISIIQAAQVRGPLKNTFTEHWPTYLGFLRVSKEFAGSKQNLTWEVEGQVAKHFGLQHHWETNALVVARWNPFFWDDYIDTSLAVGEGLSYASEIPEVERKRHQETARLLNYLLFELTLALPRYPNLQATAVMHHRSGAFGLFSGVQGGSNFIGYGVKYLFW